MSLLDDRAAGVSRISRVRRTGGWAATRWSDIVAADLPSGFDGLGCGAGSGLRSRTLGRLRAIITSACRWMPPLLCLGAEVELVSRRGCGGWPWPSSDRVRRTARAADELVSPVFVPDLAVGTVAGLSWGAAVSGDQHCDVAASLRIEAGDCGYARAGGVFTRRGGSRVEAWLRGWWGRFIGDG